MATKMLSADKLRWFAAETLIVVLGILIALSLDDYMSARRDRALAIDYVQRLHCSVMSDLNYTQEFWTPRIEMKRDALQAVLPVIRGDEPVPDDVHEFLGQVSLGGVSGTGSGRSIARTVFEDLRSTGNLRLIEGPLRGAISFYYLVAEGLLKRIQSRNTEYVSYVHGSIPAELRDDITNEDLEDFGIDFALKNFLSDDFRSLANQEYNRLLFMETIDFEGLAEQFLGELEAYRQQYASSMEWHCED